jgi:hypothetical protein
MEASSTMSESIPSNDNYFITKGLCNARPFSFLLQSISGDNTLITNAI